MEHSGQLDQLTSHHVLTALDDKALFRQSKGFDGDHKTNL